MFQISHEIRKEKFNEIIFYKKIIKNTEKQVVVKSNLFKSLLHLILLFLIEKIENFF